MPSGGVCTANVAPPLSGAELAAALAAIGGFEPRPRIAVAVSGGPDSMALMLLADRWARERGGTAVGLTVDHGLRPESSEEARRVAAWLERRGIAHALLPWRGPKPASRIQETARAARYELLAGWCRAHGFLHLFAAHHREDQAETYLIRRRAGSGIDGLAAMSAVRELVGCRLLRPLLDDSRSRLAAFLATERQPFLSDPSNLNPVFERTRLRVAEPDTAIELVLSETRRSAERRIAREASLYRLIGRAVRVHPAGFAVVDRALFTAADDDCAARLLARVAACIGGTRYPPRQVRLARLRDALREQPSRAATLAGCRFVPWRGCILVLRELAAAAAPTRLAPGIEIAWDGRFAARLPPEAQGGFRLGCLGVSGAALPGRGMAAVPPLVDPTLPALWDEEGLAAVPHLGYRRAGVGALPLLLFGPANALTDAGFTVV